MEPTTTPRSHRRARRVTVGVVSAALALGVGELAGALAASWRGPVVAVADEVINRSPTEVTRFGIRTFGSNDKLALSVGILIVVFGLAAAVGIAGTRRWQVAVGAFASLGAVGALAALQAPGVGVGAALPSLVAALAGIVAFRGLAILVPSESVIPPAPAVMVDGAVAAEGGGGASRRTFIALSAGVVGLAAVAAAGGRALRERFSAVESREKLVLPKAPDPLPAVPAEVTVDVPGMTPFVTPNRDFYRVDEAFVVPQVPVETWTLRVHGMVDREIEIDFDQLVGMGLVERDITLTCVSNQVGGRLIGNARWLGVPVRRILDEAGVAAASDQIVGRSADGYTCGYPVRHAYEHESLVAVGMNGEALPLSHGFPARLITAGLYGYVSATKWLTELELTTFAAFDSYWVPRGYAAQAPVKTQSRIDVPRSGQSIDAGPAVLAGVAWAQTRGVDRVEVQIDDQPFRDADLAEAQSTDTWRQWRLEWDAEPGAHRITVRATDGTGEVQTEERSEIYPDGATGWMTQLVNVRGG